MPEARGHGPKPPVGGGLKAPLEEAIETLPGACRLIFVLCDVEGLDPAEAAECLDLSRESVSFLLQNARASAVASALFPLQRDRCDRVVRDFFAMAGHGRIQEPDAGLAGGECAEIQGHPREDRCQDHGDPE